MSRLSVLVLVALGLLVVVCAAGQILVPWEWWTFLLILSAMAFVVALVLTVVRRAATAH